MTELDIKSVTDDELVQMSGSTTIGTGAGQKAQHAQAELMRRLMESITNLNKETSRYSQSIVDLTILLFAISFLQLLVSLKAISMSMTQWIILAAFVMYFIYRLTRFLTK